MKERRLVVSFDLDDVITHTAYNVIDYYKQTHGHVVDPAHFYEGTPEDWGVTELIEINRRIERYFRTKEFGRIACIPDPEALIVIPELAKQHELHIVTGRAKFMRKFTDALVEEHFPDCFSSIVHTNFFKKSNSRTKGQVCRDLGVDVHVDDHLVHCESVLNAGIEHAIAFGDYEWNRRELVHPGLRRSLGLKATQMEISNIAAA